MPARDSLAWFGIVVGLATLAGGCRSVTYLGAPSPDSRQDQVQIDRSAAGGPLNIGGLAYARGVGVRGDSELVYRLSGAPQRFEAWAGIDVTSGPGVARFEVYADDELAFDSGPVRSVAWAPDTNPNHAVAVRVPLTGVRGLRLVVRTVEGAGATLAADWADARLVPADLPDFEPPPPVPPKALTPTPPLGWSSWNAFGPEINEQLIRETADALVASGLRDAGFVYVNLDDGWQGEHGYEWNVERFPGGLPALGAYLHARGLRFGIYSRPAWVNGEEERVAAAFASWGVDYLKYDFSDENAEETNRRMVAALRRTGRPIVFNVCEWGKNRPWEWAGRIDAQTWRTTYDVVPRWEAPADCNRGIGVLTAIDQNEALGRYTAAGRWNDPDMLVIGLSAKPSNFGPPLAAGEERAQVGLWALLAAPLMIGCDVRNLDAPTRQLLTNLEIIAIDQDRLGVPARRVRKLADREVWAKPLSGGDLAVGLLNRSEQPATVSVRWTDLNIHGPRAVRDVFGRQDLGVMDARIERPVAAHELVLLRLGAARATGGGPNP